MAFDVDVMAVFPSGFVASGEKVALIIPSESTVDVPDADTYRGFADLASRQSLGRDYEILVRRRRDSSIAVIAPHAGEIEDGTSEIARAIAGEDFNLYLFEGRRPSHNYRALHLTSHRFDEPQCLALIAGCTTVIAIHGCAGAENALLLGGRDHGLRDRLADGLRAMGVEAVTHGHPFPAVHPDNICNRGATGRGVQIEFPNPLRQPIPARFVAAAVRRVLEAVDAPCGGAVDPLRSGTHA